MGICITLGPPTITANQVLNKVAIGDNAVLSVNISPNDILTNITWNHQNTSFGILNKRITVSNSHMLPTNETPVTSTLQIRSVVQNDMGAYMVTGCNSALCASLELMLVVSLPPLIISLTPNQSQIINNIGDSVTFECVVVGSPKPSIIWYQDGEILNITARTISVTHETRSGAYEGHIISQVTSQLIFNHIVDEDTGIYECIVNDTVMAGGSFPLTVQCE